MASASDKDDCRRAIADKRREGREALLSAKRHIVEDDSASTFAAKHHFDSLFQTFRKPNSAESFESLKKMNRLFFDSPNLSDQRRWIDEFFRCGEGNVHKLVGVFTNFNLDDGRTQAEAGFCLSNLCCTRDPKQQTILLRLVTPYFVTFLADGSETTRISLAIASLRGLANLASDVSPKICQGFLSQHAVETVGAMSGHTNAEIRDAAFCALESILSLFLTNVKEDLEVSLKNLRRMKPELDRYFYDTLYPNRKDDLFPSSTSVHCASCLFLLSTLGEESLPTPSLPQTQHLLATMERAERGPWEMRIIMPLWRAIGMFLARESADDGGAKFHFDDDSVETFLKFVVEHLHSQYIPLRKETLWVLSNFAADYEHCRLAFDGNSDSGFGAGRLLVVVDAVAHVASITVCKDTLHLCVRVFFHFLLNVAHPLARWSTKHKEVLVSGVLKLPDVQFETALGPEEAAAFGVVLASLQRDLGNSIE